MVGSCRPGPNQPSETVFSASASREFADHWVLNRLDLLLGPGSSVAVTRANGSGRTTLLRCVAGSVTPTSGGSSWTATLRQPRRPGP